MSDAGHQLTEYEASAFLPYLVMKVGDSKESIRKDVRAIFRVITNIYPSEKLYPHLVGGLKSKVNKARQGKPDMYCATYLRFIILDIKYYTQINVLFFPT